MPAEPIENDNVILQRNQITSDVWRYQ